jgi:hypothetical protein
MNERPPLPHYDPGYCLKIAKWTACICVAILVFELLVPVIFDPSYSRCPGWIINAGKESLVSWWALVAFSSGLPTAWMCYVVLRWEHFSRKMYDSIAYRDSSLHSLLFGSQEKYGEPRELNFESIFLLNSNRVFLRVGILWCLGCAFPFWIMLGSCTDLLKLIGIAYRG